MPPTRLVDLIEHNDVTPAVDQIETNPFFQRHADHEVLRANGVQIEAWGGFADPAMVSWLNSQRDT